MKIIEDLKALDSHLMRMQVEVSGVRAAIDTLLLEDGSEQQEEPKAPPPPPPPPPPAPTQAPPHRGTKTAEPGATRLDRIEERLISLEKSMENWMLNLETITDIVRRLDHLASPVSPGPGWRSKSELEKS